MGLFNWKKSEDATAKEAGAQSWEGAGFSAEKAAKFFEHAKVKHDTSQYEYAMQLWLKGLRFDPMSVPAVEGFFSSAASFLSGDNPKISKETIKEFSGKGNVEKYVAALLRWGSNPSDAEAGISATVAAAEMSLGEPGRWLGKRALNLALRDKKTKKSQLEQMMRALSKVEAFDLAVMAGDAAVRLDPSDAKLAVEVRNMSAQATMSKGGYGKTGEDGGFRDNLKNAEHQRRLEEEARISKTGETVERLLEVARREYEAHPSDRPTINNYVKRLMERGTPDDETAAAGVLSRAFEETKEFRFRQLAGDIRLRQAKRKVRELLEASPTDAAAVDRAKSELAAMELGEFEARVAAYPTDLILKFELGKRYFDAGRFEDAVGMFQDAKSDAKNRAAVLGYLGASFRAMGWFDEAVETYRQAIEIPGAEESLNMDLRYGLLCALQDRGEEQKDLGNAEEAYKLASSIAIQQINFKDIRVRREQIKGLMARLKGG
ncbi:MAG: hypothetical protein JNM07_09580 [Phycisphaerae bacterium]|nr:hypothetical protein [Phycisphaerae bacterium]